MTQVRNHNPFADPGVATSYDLWFETRMGRVADRLEKALIYRLAQPVAGERALDVGTGTGHFACDLARRGLRVTAIDPSEAMLEVARTKNCDVIWDRGEAESLPYVDESFALVLSVTMLEFVRSPADALAEMFRVVARGGRMVVAVLNLASAWSQARVAEARKQETPFRSAHFFAPEEFAAALEAHGRPEWSSSVFFAPSGRGVRVASVCERLGQTLRKGSGALLVGRIRK